MSSRFKPLAALLFLALLSCWSVAPLTIRAEQPQTGSLPKLRIETRLADQGQMEEGDPLTACFRLHNTGTAPLHFKQVQSGSERVRVDCPDSIPAGKSANVRLSVATLGIHGRCKFKAVLYTDDPVMPLVTLTLQADIDPLVALTPDRIFFDGTQNDPGRFAQEIRIHNRGAGPVKVTLQPNPLADKIKADLIPMEPGKTFRLQVKNIAAAPVTFRGRLILSTDHPGRERIIVPVFARLPAPVAVYPEKLTLITGRCPKCRARGIYTGHVLLRAHDQKPLHILSTGPQRRDLQLDTAPLITGRAFRIKVRYESGETSSPERLVIQTDREGFETIEVPVVIGDR